MGGNSSQSSHFPQVGGNRTSEAPGVVFDPTTRGVGVETPPPNDSLKASLSPPVGGHLRSFRRDWQTNKCLSNVNIITNGYVLPFLSKPSLVRFPLIQSEYKACQKDQALATCIQSLLSKNAIERVENVCKISRVLQSPVSSPQASPKVEAGHRPKQAQHLSTCRKVQNGNSRVHQDLPDSWVIDIVDRPIRRLPSHPHPYKLKVVGVPVHLPPFRTGHSPPDYFTMIVKEVKLMALSRGLKLHQYLDDWLIRSQSQEEAQVNTRAVADLTQSLDWIIYLEKSELKPTQVFSFVGFKYHLDSALVKLTKERWLKLQDLILRLKSKHVLTARCFMSLIGLLASTEKMVPEGRLHMRLFQFHLKEHWRYPQSLDSLLPWTEAISAHLDWWQNPSNMMRGADLHPQGHSIQLFTDASNKGWGTHVDQSSTKGLARPGKKATHKRSRIEGDLPGPWKLQGPVPEPNSASCNGQLSSGSLHKQTRRNSAEMCALLWKIMTWCHHYHITLKARHIPGCLNVMAVFCPGRTKCSQQNGRCIRRCSNRSAKSGSHLM